MYFRETTFKICQNTNVKLQISKYRSIWSSIFVSEEVWLDIIGNLLKISDKWTIFVQTRDCFPKRKESPNLVNGDSVLNQIQANFYTYSYGSPKLSRFSWRRKTILVAARRETWQSWSRRELHFSLLDERLSILVATCCYEAPQDLLISGRQTRQILTEIRCKIRWQAQIQIKIKIKTRGNIYIILYILRNISE